MADIQVDSITNATNTGIFDKLMEAVNAQIESQFLANRITGSDYANVYLGSIQSVLQQSVQFALQEQLTEAQIADVIAGTTLKDKQLEIAEVERLTKLYEKDTLLVDQHNTNTKQQTLLDTQEQAEQYKADFILPAELAQVQKQTDVAERSIVEQELTGAKQRIILDTEEQAKQYEVDNILPEQLTKLQEEIDLLQTQDSETLLDGTSRRALQQEQLKGAYTQRVLQDKQAAKLGLDNTMKNAEAARASDPNALYVPKYEV